MSNSFKTRSLRLESLENRQLFAGDVFAAVSQGTLQITEAFGQVGQPQSVEISQTPFDPMSIRVRGRQS